MKIVYILLISIKIDTTKETQNTYYLQQNVQSLLVSYVNIIRLKLYTRRG